MWAGQRTKQEKNQNIEICILCLLITSFELEGLAICSNNQFVKTILGINEYSIIIFTVKSKQKYLNLETKVGADEAALPNVKN